MTATLLIVDDEAFVLDLISTYLGNEGYQFVTARNGIEAWRLLEKSPEDYDAVILDRMMPGMGGMEVLARMKAHEFLKMVPVIFQTGMIRESDILEGLQAGVDYYLTKPFKKDVLLAVVRTALSAYVTYKSMWKNIRQTTDALLLMKTGSFEFRNFEEAQMLTSLLSGLCPNPGRSAVGLWELLINAIEHGNLGITYEEKKRLMERGEWMAEVKQRMALPENACKAANVRIESTCDAIWFLIHDQGAGFDWDPFMELRTERAFDPNGRGIHMARTVSFDQVEFMGSGNKVMAVIHRKNRDRSF